MSFPYALTSLFFPKEPNYTSLPQSEDGEIKTTTSSKIDTWIKDNKAIAGCIVAITGAMFTTALTITAIFLAPILGVATFIITIVANLIITASAATLAIMKIDSLR